MAFKSPSFEGLEARILMSASSRLQPDLGVSVNCPDQFVPGQSYHVTVDLTNVGEAYAGGKGTFRFYLVPDDVEYDNAPANAYSIYSYSTDLDVAVDGGQQIDICLPISSHKAEGSYTLYVRLSTGFTDACPEDNYQEIGVEVVPGEVDVGVVDASDFKIDGHKITGLVDLSSYGNYSHVGLVNFNIFAVAVGDDESQKILVKSFSRDVTFDEDDLAQISVDTTMSSALADGRYNLIIQADPKSGDDVDTDDNSLTLSESLTVGKNASLVNVGVSAISGEIQQNRAGQVWFTLLRQSDVSDVGQVEYSVYLSASGKVDDQAVLLTTFQEYVDFSDGDYVDVSGTFELSADVASGNYQMVVIATPLDQTDADLSDNTVVAEDLVAVQALQAVDQDPEDQSDQEPTDWRAYYETYYREIDQQMDLNVEVSSNGISQGGTGSATICMNNDGWQQDTGNVQYKLYLSATGTVDDSAVLLTTVTRQDNLDWDSASFSVDYQLPAGTADGVYRLVVEATPLDYQDANLSNNVSASGQVILGRDVSVHAGVIRIIDGRSGNVDVTVLNHGTQNIGTVRYEVFLTPISAHGNYDSVEYAPSAMRCAVMYYRPVSFITDFRSGSGTLDENAVMMQAIDRNDGLAAGAAASFSVGFTIPDGLADGRYYLTVRATTLDGQDVHSNDNIASFIWQTISLKTTDDGTGQVQIVSVSANYIAHCELFDAVCLGAGNTRLLSSHRTVPLETGIQTLTGLGEGRSDQRAIPTVSDSACLDSPMVDGLALDNADIDVSVVNPAAVQLYDNLAATSAGQLSADPTSRPVPVTDSASSETANDAVVDILNDSIGNKLTDALDGSNLLVRVI